MRNPAFNSLLDTMRELHDRKNSDYAKEGNPYSNFEFAAEYAGTSVDQVFATLMGVKEARIRELRKGKTPNNESLGDSYLDLAIYATLRAAYHLSRAGMNGSPGGGLRHLPMYPETAGLMSPLAPALERELFGGE